MNFASQSLVTAARNTFHIFSPIHHPKSPPLKTHHRVMSTFQAVPARGSTPAYSVFSKPIEKSPQDDRDYRIIKLVNGLNATVVHDPTADKAAASLDVAVGHLSDPVSLSNEHALYLNQSLSGMVRTICLVWLTSVNICCLWYVSFVSS